MADNGDARVGARLDRERDLVDVGGANNYRVDGGGFPVGVDGLVVGVTAGDDRYLPKFGAEEVDERSISFRHIRPRLGEASKGRGR